VAEPPPRPVAVSTGRFWDSINVKIRDGKVANGPVYVAFAVTVEAPARSSGCGPVTAVRPIGLSVRPGPCRAGGSTLCRPDQQVCPDGQTLGNDNQFDSQHAAQSASRAASLGSAYDFLVTRRDSPLAEVPVVVGPSPAPSSPGRRRAMQSQRSRDTGPEVALRRALHRRGLRFRVHQRPLQEIRRTVDIAFRLVKVAVEVRGCFWHACPDHGTRPRSNAQWWDAKLSRTQQRDRETAARLQEAGWFLIVVWEHEDTEAAAELVTGVVRQRRSDRSLVLLAKEEGLSRGVPVGDEGHAGV